MYVSVVSIGQFMVDVDPVADVIEAHVMVGVGELEQKVGVVLGQGENRFPLFLFDCVILCLNETRIESQTKYEQ